MNIPDIQREFRAVWIATVHNLDWPSKQTLTPANQRAELVRIFNLTVEWKLNAIILVPPCLWLSDSRPPAPQVNTSEVDSTGVKLSWKTESPVQPFLWCLYVRRGDTWETLVLAGPVDSWTLKNAPGAVSDIALSAVNRLGNESERTMVVVG